jgi:hypothetical protein
MVAHDVDRVAFVGTNLLVTQSGGSANAFVMRLSSSSGAATQVELRYNTALRLHGAVLRSAILTAATAAGMPPFPGKHSFSRQTPAFLSDRGARLAAYLQAALAHREVAALPEVQSILAGAGSASYDGGTPPLAGSPEPPVAPVASPRAASPEQHRDQAPAPPAKFAAAGGSRTSTMPAMAVPLMALAASLAIGKASDHPIFVTGCFALGVAAGARPQGEEPPVHPKDDELHRLHRCAGGLATR